MEKAARYGRQVVQYQAGKAKPGRAIDGAINEKARFARASSTRTQFWGRTILPDVAKEDESLRFSYPQPGA